MWFYFHFSDISRGRVIVYRTPIQTPNAPPFPDFLHVPENSNCDNVRHGWHGWKNITRMTAGLYIPVYLPGHGPFSPSARIQVLSARPDRLIPPRNPLCRFRTGIPSLPAFPHCHAFPHFPAFPCIRCPHAFRRLHLPHGMWFPHSQPPDVCRHRQNIPTESQYP